MYQLSSGNPRSSARGSQMLRGILFGGRVSPDKISKAVALTANISITRFAALGSCRTGSKKTNDFQTGRGLLGAATAQEMAVTFGGLGMRDMSLVGTLILDLAINWVAWAIAASLKTEKFYDAVGSLSFLAVVISSLVNGGDYNVRQIGISAMIGIWTLRLGSFLLFRAVKCGGDSRFSEATEKPSLFFVYWTMQAVWVWVCSLPVIIINGSGRNPSLFPTDIIAHEWGQSYGLALNLWLASAISITWDTTFALLSGVVLFVTGLLLESTADFQKLLFKMNPENKGCFINTGIWKYARYPNYFGEMTVWWGIFLTSARALHGWEFLSVASPLLTMTLLLGLSGIPLQEKQAKERWSSNDAYQEYRRKTNLLVPIPKFWMKT